MHTFFRRSTQLILGTFLSLSTAGLMATEIQQTADPAAEALSVDPQMATGLETTNPAATALRKAEALISQHKGKEALAALNDILDQYPTHRKTLYTKAKLLAAAQRLDEAQQIVDELLQDKPVAALVLHLQGYIYSRRKQWPQALEYYEQAYPHGHDRYLMNTMTSAYLHVKGPDATIDFLSVHLLEYPTEHNIRLSRAKLYQRQHQFSAALQDYELIKAEQPDNPVVWKNMADMFITQRDKRAIPYAKEAVRLAPTVPEVNDTLGRALLEFGEATEALEVLTRAHKAKPRDASIAYDYALALAANQAEEAAGKIMRELATSDSPVGTRARRYLEDQGR
jgi:tetratricopeptide (TPR) repeat protein